MKELEFSFIHCRGNYKKMNDEIAFQLINQLIGYVRDNKRLDQKQLQELSEWSMKLVNKGKHNARMAR